jgi:hypothetical protein
MFPLPLVCNVDSMIRFETIIAFAVFGGTLHVIEIQVICFGFEFLSFSIPTFIYPFLYITSKSHVSVNNLHLHLSV